MTRHSHGRTIKRRHQTYHHQKVGSRMNNHAFSNYINSVTLATNKTRLLTISNQNALVNPANNLREIFSAILKSVEVEAREFF